MSKIFICAFGIILTLFVGCKEDVAPLIDQGHSLRNKGDLDSALVIFDHAIEVDPNASEALNGRGLVKKLLGDTLGALADYDRAIAIDTAFQSALNNRGVLFDCMGSHEQAILDLERAVALDSTDPGAIFNLAGAAVHAGRYSQALLSLQKYRLVAGTDSNPRLYYFEGYSYAALDSFQLAEDRFSEYLKQDPNGCNYDLCLVNRAINRINLGMYDSAYAELTRAEKRGDRDYEVYYHQGLALKYLGRERDAIEAYNQAIAFDSTDCCTFWYLGECKEKTGDKAGACSAYQRAVDLGHKDVNGIMPKLCARK